MNMQHSSSSPRFRPHPGFTLVEVAIAMCILAGISLGFITFVQGASREIRFGVERFTGILLSQKVMEDLSNEISFNPHAFKHLGIEDSQLATKVVDGESPFFSNLEDRVQPWNQIDPITDGMVDSTVQPLYSQVKDFFLKVSAVRNGEKGPASNLFKTTIEWNWRSTAGSGKIDSACLFFSPNDIPIATMNVDISFAEEDLARDLGLFFFNTPYNSLFQFNTARGGDLNTLGALARLKFQCWKFLQLPSLVAITNQIQGREEQLALIPSGDPEKQFQANLELAKDYYGLAQVTLQMVMNLEADFSQVRNNLNAAQLGSVYSEYKKWGQILAAYGALVHNYENSLRRSRHHYLNLLTPKLVNHRGPKAQEHVTLRLINLFRIGALNRSFPNEMVEYKLFLNLVHLLYQKRNPGFTRFLRQEKEAVEIEQVFRKRHPQMNFLADFLSDRLSVHVPFLQPYYPALKRDPPPPVPKVLTSRNPENLHLPRSGGGI